MTSPSERLTFANTGCVTACASETRVVTCVSRRAETTRATRHVTARRDFFIYQNARAR